MRTPVLLLLALLAPAASPLTAQQLAKSPFARFGATLPPPPLVASLVAGRSAEGTGRDALGDRRLAPPSRDDTGRLVFAGVLGGALGLVAGGLVGNELQATHCEDCYLAAVAGAVLGESLAIPLAVHLADGRRGQPAPGMVASLAILAGGFVVARQLHRGEVLLAVPLLQIAAAVASERHTASRGTAGRPPN